MRSRALKGWRGGVRPFEGLSHSAAAALVFTFVVFVCFFEEGCFWCCCAVGLDWVGAERRVILQGLSSEEVEANGGSSVSRRVQRDQSTGGKRKVSERASAVKCM